MFELKRRKAVTEAVVQGLLTDLYHIFSLTRKIVNTPKMNYLAFHTGTNLRTKKYGHFSRPMLTRIYKTSDTYPPFLQNVWWISTNCSQKLNVFTKFLFKNFHLMFSLSPNPEFQSICVAFFYQNTSGIRETMYD